MTPLRGRSPDLPSIQIQFSDEQESSNQSNECSEIPVSIEACDKKHDVPVAPTSMNSSPPARQKISNSQPSGKRNSLSPKKDLICACQHELSLKARSSVDPNHCGEAEDKEKDVRPVPPNKGAEFAVGIDIKMDEMEDMKMKANVTGEFLNKVALKKVYFCCIALCELLSFIYSKPCLLPSFESTGADDVLSVSLSRKIGETAEAYNMLHHNLKEILASDWLSAGLI